MFRYSIVSKNRLSTCHPDLQTLFNEVIKYYDCTIVCGHRGQYEQDAAYNAGYSQVRWPNSRHNSFPSMAVDAAPYEQGIDWGKLQSAYFAGRVMGIADKLYSEGKMTHRVRCGIDWDRDNDIDDTKFWDAGHFELVG